MERLADLDWLHDSDVLAILYDGTEPGRSLRIRLQCPDDCGYPEWEGRAVSIVARRITAFRHAVWGQANIESFDGVELQISADLHTEIRNRLPPGHPGPAIECTMIFHSGSTLELACEKVEVEVAEGTERDRSE